MATILPNGKTQFVDQNGKPLANGTVTFYIPGTTTKKDTWQDQAQMQVNTNPVQLDSRGQATIWGSGSYRQVVADKFGAQIWDQVISDPTLALQQSIDGFSAPGGSALVGFLQVGVGSVARIMQDKARESLSVRDFGAKGDGVTDDTVAIGNAAVAAKANGKKLYFPAGTYLHNDEIVLDSIMAYGEGPLTQIISTSTAAAPNHAIVLTGTYPFLTDVVVSTAWTGSRQSNDLSSAIYASGSVGGGVGRIRVLSAASVGILLSNANDFEVVKAYVTGTLADGCHIVKGCKHIRVRGYTSYGTGDDCLSVVSSTADSVTCYDIQVDDLMLENGTARGLAVVGGAQVKIGKMFARNCASAGLYVASESVYSTPSNSDVQWDSVTVDQCGTSTVAAVHLTGRDGYSTSGVRGTKTVVTSPRYNAVQVGDNTAIPGVLGAEFQSLTVYDATAGAPLLINGAKDVEVGAMRVYNASGGAIITQGAGCQGHLKLGRLSLQGLNQSAGASVNAVQIASTCAFTTVTLDQMNIQLSSNPLTRAFLSGMTSGDFYVGNISGDQTSVSFGALARRYSSMREVSVGGAPTGQTVAQGDRWWYQGAAAGSAPGAVVTTAGIVGSTAVYKAMANLSS
ncbi:glycosyl hydrolase family 28-related protein [Burkholderia vietnamiensis]|uniref:glycosyl hydrolase family 28-related protein n=1 Tax=Burkholderia vietnamiensis TaxID=60552 RepID=UPI00264A7B1D|nr:glycosyl hydrolase family 28-related protein [Burkholderia vietnamiensis]MDN7814674.1 glycosyl hydrolase family 28-related protein [Burkholderia vietnamiensis]MDN8066338.1 glycosyl hydrolase family 28-related protein [Burkholderia vietnamiensis]HDR9033738.1 hypothetical protein [Burkholderia vietnamiensis]